MFISRQVKMPLPLSLLGVTGGLLGFGLLGVFIGPVVMGLVQNLWLAWTEEVSVADEEVEQQTSPVEPPGAPETPESPETPPLQPPNTPEGKL
jgi:predicted PurR-regulated permease PerM